MDVRAKLAVATCAVLGIGGTVATACGCTLPTFSTPPPGLAGCNTADASGCATYSGGTFLTYTNPTHADSGTVGVSANSFLVNCTKNLLTYASSASAAGNHQDAVVTGSGWPVHFNINFTGTYNPNMVQVKLTTGCVGQGNGKIDLITHMVEGVTNGAGDDGMKIDKGAGCPLGQEINDPGRTGANCPGINIAGDINCGPLISPNHQDAFQEFGGDNIHMYDVRSGNWATQTATCTGDGGGWFISGAAPSGNNGGTCVPSTNQFCANWGWGVNYIVQRSVMITCIHGLDEHLVSLSTVVNGQNSTGTIRNSIFRSGKCGANPGALGASGTNYNAGIVKLHTGAPGWTIGTSSTVATDTLGDTWCPSACLPGWTGYNPANDSR